MPAYLGRTIDYSYIYVRNMFKPSRHILFLLAILTAISCRKEERINTYDPDLTLTQKYTHLMGGARGWTAVMNQNDSTFELNDIAFTIDIINDTTIKVFSDTLLYVLDDTANSLFYVKSTQNDFC